MYKVLLLTACLLFSSSAFAANQLVEIATGEFINMNHVESVRQVDNNIYINFSNSTHDRLLTYQSTAQALTAYGDLKKKLGMK